MGWNSWNTFGCDINEQLIRDTADSMVSSGMARAGYRYVVIDDCWFDPQRAADGSLRAHPQRFPSGIKALADYIHGKGLKFGIYQVPTEKTCAQRGGAYPGATGSRGHEVRDARTFAEWGVDYLKYDWCSPEGTLADQIAAFTVMRDALRSTGRDIVYSINANSYHDEKNGAKYDWSAIADQWRTTEDIKPVWRTGNPNTYPMGVTDIIDVTEPLRDWAGPGHWNDPDMLEVGVYNVEGFPGLTDTEARAHFSMWAMLAAPMIAGNDLRAMPGEIRKILTNRGVLAVSQDRRGVAADRVRDDGDLEVWARPLAGGDVAVALFNRSERAARITARTGEVGLRPGPHLVTDLWTGRKSVSRGELSAEVPVHGVVLLRVRPLT
ncbi:glycoside hydrolase family 27 protein [Amycolatopsis suaedae]|uniref:Alpha-galactosidase n=1 Tax=Amycolatopsis suaedae TaxID=2510978 RepID=A0A4V2EMS4_9PSEU|nr:glycoside hydrolase family 27 protein [Amycolatopsis suaedae]